MRNCRKRGVLCVFHELEKKSETGKGGYPQKLSLLWCVYCMLSLYASNLRNIAETASFFFLVVFRNEVGAGSCPWGSCGRTCSFQFRLHPPHLPWYLVCGAKEEPSTEFWKSRRTRTIHQGTCHRLFFVFVR